MKIYRYIALVLGLSAATSCNVLDVTSQDAIPANEVFKDKAGIERGILGAYSSLQSLSYYGRNYAIFADLAADNLQHPPNATSVAFAEIDNNAILPENSAIDGVWSAIYDGINVTNNVIAQVPNVSGMTQAEKDAALGELYFLRALHHFNLMNYFGAIPVKTTPTVGVANVDVPRDQPAAVYAQIVQDLTFAVDHLPKGGSKVRANGLSAQALLSRVRLYQREYAAAYDAATGVITSTQYSLPAQYADVFAADGSAETIFEVDFLALDRNRIAEYNFPLTLNGRYEVAPTPGVLAAYESGDQRKNVSANTSGALPYAIKYDDLSTGGDNFIVLRLAEMYLNRAEAVIAMNNGGLDNVRSDINAVRRRAGLSDVTSNDPLVLLQVIEEERRREFAFEGHRWFDLVRTNRALEVLPTVTSSNQLLFPIPLSEMLTNKHTGMYQNPGY